MAAVSLPLSICTAPTAHGERPLNEGQTKRAIPQSGPGQA